MTRLSVNINKVALIRNARGENLPDLKQFAIDCESYGAEGITVHPRPDERHITYADIPILKEIVTTEFNIEGNPNERFMELVLKNKPHQCTLVPDAPGVLTSSEGWDTVTFKNRLKEITKRLQGEGIRVSLFVDAKLDMIEGAKEINADRIELYTGKYAHDYLKDPAAAIENHIACSKLADKIGIGLNAGHDLNLENLKYYKENLTSLAEVSIGQAIVSDALYYGISNTIGMYKRLLE